MCKKKLFGMALCCCLTVTVLAQSKFDSRPEKPFFLSAQGGFLVSVNENSFMYSREGLMPDLITMQGSVMVGVYVSNHFSLRASLGYGNNASANNTENTASRRFYPYNFKSVNAFFDVAYDFLDRNMTSHFFLPRVYLGAGFAHSFGFTSSGHPWQKSKENVNTFGFRAGATGEFQLSKTFSVFLDLCAEAYGDWYNGLRPSKADQKKVDGYAGFPFDMRGVASVGVMFHF